jgi:hypothetical protein
MIRKGVDLVVANAHPTAWQKANEDATHLVLGIERGFLQDSSGSGVSQEKQSRSP